MRRIGIALLLMLLLVPVTIHAAPPFLAGCQMFPSDNAWNTSISNAPVHPDSARYIKYINQNGGKFVHPDFGGKTNNWYGIPWTTATSATPLVPMSFDYDSESEPGPYPIPAGAPIEGGGHVKPNVGGDRHILVLETTNCILYEVYRAYPNGSGGFDAGSGAIFDLGSNDLRPEGWTSADAAGLPILPGLANCAEANSGVINHALRFTVGLTSRNFIYPATHFAPTTSDVNAPPMGLRLRLKANYNLAGFTGQALTIATALKQYGMILADNGSNWYISGEYNPDCWNDSNLGQLKGIPGKAFEVVVSPPPPSEVENDLIRNGSFEAGSPNGKNPAYWTVSAHKDRRICSQQINISGVGWRDAARSGRCAFEFKGTKAAPNDFIVHTLLVPPLAAGSNVNISLYAAISGVAPDTARMKVISFYSNAPKSAQIVSLGSGSNAYAAVQAQVSDANITNLTKVKIKIMYKGTSGQLWVDDVSAVAVDVTRDVLPLPAASLN